MSSSNPNNSAASQRLLCKHFLSRQISMSLLAFPNCTSKAASLFRINDSSRARVFGSREGILATGVAVKLLGSVEPGFACQAASTQRQRWHQRSFLPLYKLT